MSNNSSSHNSSSVNELNNTVITDSKIYINVMAMIKKGRIFYHAIKSKLITRFKSIFNHISNTYHLYGTYIIDGNVAIDWENSRSVSDAEMKEWSDSFLAYSNSKKESSSIFQN